MHLVPAERIGRRIIEDEKVCAAISGIGDLESVSEAAERFAVLGSPSRLTILLALHHAGPISVSDLAVAADMTDSSVSQALRLLKTAGVVRSERDGRVVRYRLACEHIAGLLDVFAPVESPPRTRRTATRRPRSALTST